MSLRGWIAVGILAALSGSAFAWTRSQAMHRIRSTPTIPLSIESLGEPDKHKVTSAMLSAAETHDKTIASSFQRTDAEGVLQDLDVLKKSGPLVVIFIKDGCPCSVSAESYFNSLHALYRGRLRFLGIIDVDAAKARRWATVQGVPFPIIPDPHAEIAQKYGVTNSAFVALIDSDGNIDKLWPGYSASMLQELNRRAALLAGFTPETFETGDAPEDLYSGCPFSED